MIPWSHPNPQPKRRLYRFSHLCTDVRRVSLSLYFTMGRQFSPKICPFPWSFDVIEQHFSRIVFTDSETVRETRSCEKKRFGVWRGICREVIHRVSKNVPSSTCYNLDIHDPMTIIFGRSVTEKVRNQTMLCSPTSLI